MSAAKHTPAPWRYEAPDEVCIKDADGGRVAILTNLRGALGMSGRRDPNEVIANARLIAAAPEFYEWAVKAISRKHRGQVFLDYEDVIEMENIVAKVGSQS